MTSSQPLVSVITPFLNGEKYITEAILSVISQTYPHWELLLIDDGSTDKSTAIARQYASQYPGQIIYLEHPHHENRGKSTSRNLGINTAQGKYIAFLDADDIFLPEKLARQVQLLENYPEVAMVYGPTLYWYSWTGKLEDQKKDYLAKLGVLPPAVINPPQLITLFLKDPDVIPSTCGLLARRDHIQALGGFEESIQYMYEDQVLITKIGITASVLIEEECGDKYRQHPESTSYLAMNTGKYNPGGWCPSQQVFLTWLQNYIQQLGIDDPELWRFLHKQLLPYRYPLLWIISDQIKKFLYRLRSKFKNLWANGKS